MTTDHSPAPTGRGVFRVLVTGSRTWSDQSAITTALDQLHARHGTRLRVVHGACPRGADAIADTWAARHGVPVETYPADWRAGPAAGPARNAAMVATGPHACLAFIADASHGATGTADLAQAAGIPTTRHTTGTQPSAAAGSPPAGEQDRGTDDGRLIGNDAARDSGQLVAVADGPLAGQWFTWADWQQRLRAARHTFEACGHRSPALDYLPAGYQVPNPVREHTHGWAAVYRPADGTAHASAPAHDQDATNSLDTAALDTAALDTAAADDSQDGDHLAGYQPVAEVAADPDDVLDLAG